MSAGFKEYMHKNGNAGITSVALDYACERDAITYDVISQKYCISKSAVKNCIEYCIIYCLIDLEDAIKAKNKAHRNQLKHISRYAVRTQSDYYYDKLFKQRLEYIESILNIEKICELQHKGQTYDNFVCDADIQDGYPAKDEFERQREKYVKNFFQEKKLVNEYQILLKITA